MKRPCNNPGCPSLIEVGRFCDAHLSSAPKPGADYQRWRKTNANQSAIDRFRSSSAWRRTSRLKLSSNPLCEDPFGAHAQRGTVETAKQAHHIKGLATHPELGLSWDNLMSVCIKCHARLEAEANKSPTTPGVGSKV